MRYGRFDRKYSQTIEQVTVDILSYAVDRWLATLQYQIGIHNSGIATFEGIEGSVPKFEVKGYGDASEVACTFLLETTDIDTGKLWIIGAVNVTAVKVHTCAAHVEGMPWAMHSIWRELWFEPFIQWLASTYAGEEPTRQADEAKQAGRPRIECHAKAIDKLKNGQDETEVYQQWIIDYEQERGVHPDHTASGPKELFRKGVMNKFEDWKERK